jgi:hypothetical protein
MKEKTLMQLNRSKEQQFTINRRTAQLLYNIYIQTFSTFVNGDWGLRFKAGS